MSTSATERRTANALRISRCAMALADSRGFDGFTMDDLADSADVSRRTLFNYYPGKIDAVLGMPLEIREETSARFIDGGPHGDLILDLRWLILDLLESFEVDHEQLERMQRVLSANPKLLGIAHQRNEDLADVVVGFVQQREGDQFSSQRARVVVHLLHGLFKSTMEGFLADPERRPFAEHFDQTITTARDLLGP